MRGDVIVLEPHHRRAAKAIAPALLRRLEAGRDRLAVTVAGESGSGKSETATAIKEGLAASGVKAIILQQDDYYVYPPKTNDRTRRADIGWVGPKEVRLPLMDEHLAQFKAGARELAKPLVLYAEDRISDETVDLATARVAIAEGTYTSLLENADVRIFIARDVEQTRAHREKRRRDASELDAFTERVLGIEHDIIAGHRALADIVIEPDYAVTFVT